jgi:5-methylcytosine-specific restriction protein B
MNTADRSIALLDVALRRRFEFEEMMPDVRVIREQLTATLDEENADVEISAEQVELISDVFEAMNRRISILLDRDHQIGHSYFLDVESMTDLHRVLYGRVFPLLQEYFYNDFNRLVDLLGEHSANQKTGFVKIEEDGQDTSFAMGNSHQPLWTFHRYKSGELEEALRSTFLPE